MPTLYEAFNLPETATQAQIRKRYYELARRYHPDLNGHNPEAEELLKKVNEIYDVLGEPERRREYDEGLRMKRQLDAAEPTPAQSVCRRQGQSGRYTWSGEMMQPGWGRFWEEEGPLVTPNLITGFLRALLVLFMLMALAIAASFWNESRRRQQTLPPEWRRVEQDSANLTPAQSQLMRKAAEEMRKNRIQ